VKRVRKAWSSRAMRKFRRNRLAMVGLAVIGLYAAIGLWVLGTDALKMFGNTTGWWDVSKSPLLNALTVQRADEVVAAPDRPAFGITPNPESRVRAIKTYYDEFKKRTTVRTRNKEEADRRIKESLAGIRYAELVPADKSVDEFKAILTSIQEQYDTFSSVENLDKQPELLPQIEKLEQETASLFKQPTGFEKFLYDFRMSLGTDRQGRSIMVRAVYSIKVAIQIGLVVAFLSVLLGSLLGAAAAFFGGWVDMVITWLYSTLSSLPDLVLLGVLVFMFTGSIFDNVDRPYLSLVPIYCAMCLTFWIGPCRVIRGEVMKIKELEYVQAARAIGFSRLYILIKHAVPNTLHLMFINFSLLFIAAIKNEVVLSFLGLGVKVGPSWGRMIQESIPQVLTGFYWQIGAATVFMFFLVLAFNIVSDALQDAFDPKHVG
jgi:peptide/nickel transport system permease protein